jgi:hypothetical protein
LAIDIDLTRCVNSRLETKDYFFYTKDFLYIQKMNLQFLQKDWCYKDLLYSTTINANKGGKICAYILRPLFNQGKKASLFSISYHSNQTHGW